MGRITVALLTEPNLRQEVVVASHEGSTSQVGVDLTSVRPLQDQELFWSGLVYREQHWGLNSARRGY